MVKKINFLKNENFIFIYLERSAPINMPNRQSDITSSYADPHGVVFSPKSTDPSNLGINMCINILEGDNSPRVKDNGIKDVTQHMQNMKIYVSKINSVLVKSSLLMGSILLSINGNRQALPLFIIIIQTVVLPISLDI
jgi:hypothetical protein